MTQKDYRDLHQVREFLADLGLRCGRIHNPSVRVDPGGGPRRLRDAGAARFRKEFPAAVEAK